MKLAATTIALLLLAGVAARAEEKPAEAKPATEAKPSTEAKPGTENKPAAEKPAAPALNLPKEGTVAPTFTLPNEAGKPVALEDLRGQWVVLYFYPKDFTGGCTLEAQNFQRDLKSYEEKKAVILGVSFDTVESHKEFCAKESLQFKLLADTDKAVATKYGSLMDYKGNTYPARTTFLIDPKGVIRKVYPKVDVKVHSEEVLAELTQLQTAAR